MYMYVYVYMCAREVWRWDGGGLVLRVVGGTEVLCKRVMVSIV